MQINISTKAILGVVGTIALAVSSWFAVGHIDHGNRLARLEDSDANDIRQDAELTEIRATMRDLIRLSSELSGHSHHGPLLPLLAASEDHGDDAGPPETPVEEVEPQVLSEEYGEFRSEQADLETILRGRGIKPAVKAFPNQADR